MRMSRVKLIARTLVMVILVLVILMFIPPVRNILTLGFLPRLWEDVPTLQLLKVHMNSVRSNTAALVPCTQPARALRDDAGHRDSLQQLLVSEPYGKVQARPQDEAAYSKAWTWLNQSAWRRQRYSLFAPRLSPLQKAQLLLTWRVLHEALTLHNITYFLTAGTLLGAVRHEGIIPWDDDMDVAVDEQDLDKVRRILSCIPGYTLHVQPCLQWKFFADVGHVINSHSRSTILHPRQLEEKEKRDYVVEWKPYEDVVVRSPVVDLFMLTHDGTYTWCFKRYKLKHCMFCTHDVYPLTQVNFEGYPAPVPRRSASVANRIYDANMCTSSEIDHFEGRPIMNRSVIPCVELQQMHTVYYVV